jgi:DNA-binding Lrp family transcriptional regulator
MNPSVFHKTYEGNETLEFTGRGSDDFWFACVDLMVLKDKALSPCDKTVFSVICGHVNVHTRSCPLRVKTIAEEVGCSVRSAQESLKALVDRGVIERLERFENGKQQASVYKIIGHHAPCYRGANSAPRRESDARMGAGFAPIFEFCTPRGAKNDTPSLREPNIYEIKDYSPSEREPSSPEPSSPLSENFQEPATSRDTTSQPEDSDSRSETTREETRQTETETSKSDARLFVNESSSDVNGTELITPDEAPPAMRETADYFLLKTGRTGLDPEELSALRALEKIHIPTRVNKEIVEAVERFRKNSKPLSSLTLVYIYKSLQYQNSIKRAQDKSPPQKAVTEENIPDPYEGAYL